MKVLGEALFYHQDDHIQSRSSSKGTVEFMGVNILPSLKRLDHDHDLGQGIFSGSTYSVVFFKPDSYLIESHHIFPTFPSGLSLAPQSTEIPATDEILLTSDGVGDMQQNRAGICPREDYAFLVTNDLLRVTTVNKTISLGMFCPRHQIKNLARTVASGSVSATPVPPATPASKADSTDTVAQDVKHGKPPKPFKDIPGPSWIYQWPLIGTALLFKPFSRFTPETTQSLFKHMFEKFGPIVRLRLGAPTVLLYDPKDLEQLFANEGRYPKRPSFSLTRTFNVRNGVKDSLADAIQTKQILVKRSTHRDGEDWQRLRSPLNRHLSKVNSAEHYLDSQHLVAKEFAENLVSGTGDAEDIRDWFFRYATECVSLVCLNTRLGLMNPNVPVNMDALVFLKETKNIFVQIQKVLSGKSIMHDYYLNKTYREYEKSNSFVRSYMKSKLRRAKANLDKQSGQVGDPEKNLLASLMSEPALDFEDVENMMMTLYVAGMESTATNLQSFFFELASNPEKQEKLYEEIVAVVGEEGPVTREKLRKMPYVKACLKETFRLRYPCLTGPARILQNDAVIRGFTIPAETQVLPCNSYTCQTVFQEADQFIPERWLRSNGDRKLSSDIPPQACLPFGYGPRNCIGRRFAEQQIYLAVIKTLQKSKIKLRPDSNEIVFRYSIFIEPTEAIKFKFEPRGPSKEKEDF
ncbi:hypothetical protein RRG08_004516 [Elysia crispata]|uniref:Cytochrome P450 n=1 Tax=Elysia crispata TaxID=231223 RepID=A0AAE1BB41_9GAST|nr:hypothetical protein RRG08_004516 [Elysia crispata]